MVSSSRDGLPFLQGNAEFGEVQPSARYSCAEAPKIAERGDVLLSVRAPVGALNLADRSYGIGRGLCAIRPRPGIQRRYLWWALHASTPFLYASAAGSTYDAVTVDIVSQLLIPTPAPKKQRDIADYLDANVSRIDTIIYKKRKLIRLLQERRTLLADGALSLLREREPLVPLKYLVRESDLRYGNGPEPTMLSVSIHQGVTPRSTVLDTPPPAEDLSHYKKCSPGNIVINRMRAFQGGLGVADRNGVVSPDYTVLQVGSQVSSGLSSAARISQGTSTVEVRISDGSRPVPPMPLTATR